jgi:hypothetical protein
VGRLHARIEEARLAAGGAGPHVIAGLVRYARELLDIIEEKSRPSQLRFPVRRAQC